MKRCNLDQIQAHAAGNARGRGLQRGNNLEFLGTFSGFTKTPVPFRCWRDQGTQQEIISFEGVSDAFFSRSDRLPYLYLFHIQFLTFGLQYFPKQYPISFNPPPNNVSLGVEHPILLSYSSLLTWPLSPNTV